MDRAGIYFMDKEDENTYDFDETLPSLPLPELSETLQRYYESLKPFGKPNELAISRVFIDEFEKGIGAQLHQKLKERASKTKNWVDEWWDKYGYHILRFPLNPYCVMVMAVKLELLGLSETQECMLKNFARIMYHTIEFWDLLHNAKIRPLSSNGGKIKYNSSLYKRFFSTSRVPGVEFDRVEQHFKTASDGKTPTHGILTGKGRIFMFNCVHEDGSIITPQEILVLLQRVRSIVDYEPLGDCVPVLTHDERTAWAKNRQHLLELSPANKATLKLVESSAIIFVFDENEPNDYEETSQTTLYGDSHSKWGDRASTCVSYRNGKFACIGEHSCYDGSVSVSYALFVQLSLVEVPEPDWCETAKAPVIGYNELKFDLDDSLKGEIQRMMLVCDTRRNDVIVTHKIFNDYGKSFMKESKLHPDSFVQVIMQWAYLRMHKDIASTYETALMRHYYRGRTETLRSCTSEVNKFLQTVSSVRSTKADIVRSFRAAVEHHNHMMNEARKGHGVDRHLFGLWCAAYENKIDIPKFFEDPLYAKSGGGGNFVLSTSTLGYTANVGFVAPMLLDGYGVFYSITSEALCIQVSAYRASAKTSAHKFNEIFMDSFRRMKALIEDVSSARL